MIIIPIGIQCTVGKLRQELSNNEALPFDWMFSNPKFVFEMFELHRPKSKMGQFEYNFI